MNTTLFFAHLWGPIILAIGLGIFLSRSFYIRVYRDLEKDPLAVLLFGMVAMIIGGLQIIFHNAWGSLPEVIISIIGWGFFIKGAAFIIAPKLVDRAGDIWAKKHLLPVSGIIMLVIGAYLTWLGFFI